MAGKAGSEKRAGILYPKNGITVMRKPFALLTADFALADFGFPSLSVPTKTMLLYFLS